jgi:hypothetical protein
MPSPRVPPARSSSASSAPGRRAETHVTLARRGIALSPGLPSTDRDRVDDLHRPPSALAVTIPASPKNRDPVPSPAATGLPRISGILRIPSGPRPAVAFASTQRFRPPPGLGGFWGGGASLGERRGRSRGAGNAHVGWVLDTLPRDRFADFRIRHGGAARFVQGLSESQVEQSSCAARNPHVSVRYDPKFPFSIRQHPPAPQPSAASASERRTPCPPVP